MKYLSKLLSVLLMGVMLYSTGCADYDEDIRDLNNRIDQLVSGEIQPLKADLVKVKSDLEAAIAAAQAELKNIHEVDIANLKSADEALDAKIGVANDKILDLEEALNEEVEALEADIAALNTAIEAAKQAAKDADAALKEELVKQIADLNTELSTKLATLETKLNGDIAKLREDAEKAIADANAAIDAVEARADALEAADEEFAKELKAIKADIKAIQEDLAAKYDELTKAVANLKDQVSENTKDIAALEENLSKLSETVEGINTTLADHLVAYAQFKATVEGKIATIESDIEAIEGTIESIEGTIEDLQEQISDNDADIEDIYEAIAVLVQADIDMKNLHENLVADIEKYRASLEAELKAAFGDVYDKISDLTDAHNKLVRDTKANFTAAAIVMEQLADALEAEAINRTARDNQLSAQLEALATELDAQVDAINIRVDAIEEAYKAADEQLAEDLAAAVETLNEAVEQALEDSKAYTDEEIANLKAELTEQHKKDLEELQMQVSEYLMLLMDAIDAELEEVWAAINDLEDRVTVVEDQIDAILNRVQSVVFIPKYTDGKAYINWRPLVAGDNAESAYVGQWAPVLEGVSEIDYQVYPADCAVALAEAWNNAEVDNKSFLTFDWTTVLTRGDETASPEFNIVAVEGDEDGVLHIDYKARNLNEEFYYVLSQNTMGPKNRESYSISLKIANENATLSSCFVNVKAENEVKNPAILDIVVVDNGDPMSIGTVAKPEVTDDGAQAPVEDYQPTFEIPYVDRLSYEIIRTNDEDGIADGVKETHKFLTHEVVVILDDEVLSIEEVAALGYSIEEPVASELDVTYDADDQAAYFATSTTDRENKLKQVFAGLTDASVPAAVGSKAYVNQYYTLNTFTIGAGEVVKIGKAKGNADATVADIKWTYEALYEEIPSDATVDAALLAEEEAAYTRQALEVTIDEETAKLYDFAGKYSDFIDAAILATVEEVAVAEDGTETKTAVEGVTATLAADAEEKVTLDISGFAWDKVYELTFVYELESIDITVVVRVNTLDRDREVVTLTAADEVELYKDIKFKAEKRAEDATNVPADMIVDAYAEIAARLDGIYPEADVYNEDVFVTNAYEATSTVTVWGFGSENEAGDDTKTIEDAWTTNFVLENSVLEAYVGFSYETFDFAVEKAQYKKTITLWYGQVVELVYDVTFTVPTKYDFKHVDIWVFDDDGYYSKVKPRYTAFLGNKYEVNTNTRFLWQFSVEDVDMDTAFDVVDTEAEVVEPLTDEQLAELGITTEFFFVEEPEDENIKFVDGTNSIAYNGKDEFVHVNGKLMMTHSNGAAFQLPSSFDEGKAYADYIVKKFNPLCNLSINPDAPQKIEVTEAKEYVVKAIDYFDLFESRDGSGTPYVWADGFKVNLIDHAVADWMIGSGKPSEGESTSNGWYYRQDREDIYKMTSEFSLGAEIPAQYKNNITWIPEAGVLTFDASKNIELTKDVVIPVKLSVDLPWAYTEAVVNITFGPKAGAVTPDVPVEE